MKSSLGTTNYTFAPLEIFCRRTGVLCLRPQLFEKIVAPLTRYFSQLCLIYSGFSIVNIFFRVLFINIV